MKKNIVLSLLVALFVFVFTGGTVFATGANLVTVCTNGGVTASVSISGVPGIIKSGGHIGSCSSPKPTVSPQASVSPEASPVASPSPTPSPSASPSPSPSPTPSPSVSPSPGTTVNVTTGDVTVVPQGAPSTGHAQ